MASVDFKRNVFWFRVGVIIPICTLSGLKKHPFDSIECSFSLGGWAKSGLFTNYTTKDPPVSFANSIHSKNACMEFELIKDKIRLYRAIDYYNNTYGDELRQPWPLLTYTYVFKRKTLYFASHNILEGEKCVLIVVQLILMFSSCYW